MKKTLWILCGASALLPCLSWAQADYPTALWNAANSGNFQVSNRTTSYPIKWVIIHIMEGTYSGSIAWFKDPASNVSAHYCIRSSDGQITQMVKEKDIAYHAGVWSYNTESVGIEHEATSTSTSWYTNVMYQSSANLTRYLTNKYSIPRTRTWIIGHKETGRATTCPGPYWDWTKYMALVGTSATYASMTIPTYIAPGSNFPVTVRYTNTGADSWDPAAASPIQIGCDTASPYYVPGNWASSTRAAKVSAVTATGNVGEFTFQMKAPTTSGNYSQTFGLYLDGTLISPTVDMNFGVGLYDQAFDNDSTVATYKGTWATGTTASGHLGADYRFATAATKTSAMATWNVPIPANGSYDIYGWWAQGSNRCTNAQYIVSSRRNGVEYFFANQTTNGGQWNLLGRVRLTAGTASVSLSAASANGGVVIADGVRVVGPY